MQTLKFKKTSVRNLPNGYINLSTTFPTKVFLYYIFVFSIYIIYTLPYRSISYSTPLNITFLTGLSANKSNIPITPIIANTLIVPFVLRYAYGLEGVFAMFFLTTYEQSRYRRWCKIWQNCKCLCYSELYRSEAAIVKHNNKHNIKCRNHGRLCNKRNLNCALLVFLLPLLFFYYFQ